MGNFGKVNSSSSWSPPLNSFLWRKPVTVSFLWLHPEWDTKVRHLLPVSVKHHTCHTQMLCTFVFITDISSQLVNREVPHYFCVTTLLGENSRSLEFIRLKYTTRDSPRPRGWELQVIQGRFPSVLPHGGGTAAPDALTSCCGVSPVAVWHCARRWPSQRVDGKLPGWPPLGARATLPGFETLNENEEYYLQGNEWE